MKFPYSMMLDFVKTSLAAEQAGDLLTMAGFELEGTEDVSGERVLDIKVMSNRGDGLSVFGLAREILAKDEGAQPTDLYISAKNRFLQSSNQQSSNLAIDLLNVNIQTPDCTRYACSLFTDLKSASSPSWIQDRLTKAGMRPINLLVDLTNYVMLELGQPLHAFDFDKLHGGRIIVRKAKEGEKIVTLDEQERELKPFMTMICDADRPVAVAGVMGGLETEVSATTKTMLLESAHFLNTSVRRTRRTLGMSTEASYRFERSVDPEGVVAAIRRFADLFVRCGGGNVGGEITDVYPAPEETKPISLRNRRATALLGMPVAPKDAKKYLTSVGCRITAENDNGFSVVPPSWRPDIVREEDLIEEIGRIQGYDRIPEKLPTGSTTLGGPRGYEAWEDRVRELTLRFGFSQAISHTLRDASVLDDPRLERIGPRGISDPEMMWLRTSTLPSLADAAKRNGGKNLHLFELGQIFGSHHRQIIEKTAIGFLSQGSVDCEWWAGKSSQTSSVFSLKGVLEALFARTVTSVEFRASPHPDPRFHPTRQGEIYAPCGLIGILGQIDPATAEKSGISADTILAEIDLTTAYGSAREEVQVRQLSRNPAMRRDIAFLIHKSVSYEKVRRAVIGASGDLLEEHWLFDVYEGKGIPEGQHSLAIALQLRKIGANLTDDEANQVREKVVAALSQLGATPR